MKKKGILERLKEGPVLGDGGYLHGRRRFHLGFGIFFRAAGRDEEHGRDQAPKSSRHGLECPRDSLQAGDGDTIAH